jgi:hypothetical protein
LIKHTDNIEKMKKYIKYKLVAVVALVALMFSACTDRFEEMNTSNHLVTEEIVNVDLLLTYVQVNTMRFGAYGIQGTGQYAGMLSLADGLPFTTGDSPGTWNSTYGTAGRNLADIINICNKRNEENENADLNNKIAISRILKAWAFSKMTDIYGDVPYFETCLPLEDAVLQPKYDSQKSIYEDLFKELKEAAAQLDASKPSFGSADLIYGGDVAKWKKLANSLRLRLALRVRYADPAMAEANMSDLTEADLITSGADDAFIMSADDYPDNSNTLYTRLLNDKHPHVSHLPGKTLIDILIGNGDPHNPVDPRCAILVDTAYAKWPGTEGYEDIPHFGYRGRPLLGTTTVNEKYPWGSESVSFWSPLIYAPVIEMPVLRSSEVYFALAEAALVGLKSGDANTYYQKGIDEAVAWAQRLYENGKPQMTTDLLKIYYSDVFKEWDDSWTADFLADKEITQAEIEVLKADAVYTLSGSQEQQLEMIMNQKMVALLPDGDQEWAEWRRTGYPRVLVGHDVTNNTMAEAPRRMPWPQIEQSVNSANYEAALAVLKTDDRLTKFWWDANPDPIKIHPDPVPSMDEPWVTTGD